MVVELDQLTLIQINAHLETIEDTLLVKPAKALILSYPTAGGRRAIPNGDSRIDLMLGAVVRPDGSERLSANLKTRNLPYARSGLLWVDSDVDVEAMYEGQSMGKFGVDQCSWFPFQGFAFTELKLTSSYSFNMKARFSVLPVPQPVPQIPTGFQERYGAVATSNSFTAIPFGPTLGGALGTAYLQSDIYCALMGIKVLSIYNAGAQSADLNLQLLLSAGRTWADDPATGASLTLASGNIALIETGIPTQYIRLRTRSSMAGSATTIQASYRAVTAVR